MPALIPNMTLGSIEMARWVHHPLTAVPTAVIVNCGTSAVKLPTTALSGRRTLVIQNIGTAAIFLGASGVLTTTGFKLDAGAYWVFNVGDDIDIYGICGSALTANVCVMELK